MKKSTILVAAFLLLTAITVQAQNTKTGLKKQLAEQTEKTDQAAGKKIQQQSLLKHKPEMLADTTAAVKTKVLKKTATRKKKKHT